MKQCLMRQRLKQPGQALHEYAIAIALIAIVGIGALKLLGGNISGLLGTVSSSKTQQDTQQLYSLIGADLHGGAASAAKSNASDPTSVHLSVDPDTGMIVITDSNGNSHNATSADGTMISISEAIAKLADTKMSNGQPLPNDIQDLLKKLGVSGNALGGAYGDIMAHRPSFDATNQKIKDWQNAGGSGPPPQYDSKLVEATIADTQHYLEMAGTYQQLQQKLGVLAKTDPAMADLQAKVSDYSGAISGMTLSNLALPTFSQFHLAAINPNDLVKSLKNNNAAAQYFNQVQAVAATVPPEQRDQIFQQGFMDAAKQYRVGTVIDTKAGLNIAFGASDGLASKTELIAPAKSGGDVTLKTNLPVVKPSVIKSNVATRIPKLDIEVYGYEKERSNREDD